MLGSAPPTTHSKKKGYSHDNPILETESVPSANPTCLPENAGWRGRFPSRIDRVWVGVLHHNRRYRPHEKG